MIVSRLFIKISDKRGERLEPVILAVSDFVKLKESLLSRGLVKVELERTFRDMDTKEQVCDFEGYQHVIGFQLYRFNFAN